MWNTGHGGSVLSCRGKGKRSMPIIGELKSGGPIRESSSLIRNCWFDNPYRGLYNPWATRRSNQSILKEINPGCSLEGMMLKLKLQYFGHLLWRVDSLEKTDAGRDWGQEEKGTTEDEMAGWHHGLDGCESEWTPGVGDGQGGLACCDSWGRKESDTTERLNWTELNCISVGRSLGSHLRILPTTATFKIYHLLFSLVSLWYI